MDVRHHQRNLARIISVFLALLFLFGSLTGCQSETKTMAGQSKTLRLVMQPDMSELSKTAIQYFSYKTMLLSKNQLKVVIEEVDNPISELSDAHFVFITNAEAKKVSSVFSPLESPFYFSDYMHLTISLNSDAFWDLEGDVVRSLIEVEPLGAFYDGSRVLLSSTDNMLDTQDQYVEQKIYITQDDMFEYTLIKLGATVYVREQSELIEAFNNGRNRIIECDTLQLDQIKIPPKRNNIVLCESFHKARINWLFLSSENLSSLTTEELSIIKEAAAFAVAQNDELVTSAEEQGIEFVRQLGASSSKPSYSEFSTLTADILRKSAKFSNLWDWENYMLIKEIAIIK